MRPFTELQFCKLKEHLICAKPDCVCTIPGMGDIMNVYDPKSRRTCSIIKVSKIYGARTFQYSIVGSPTIYKSMPRVAQAIILYLNAKS